MMRLDRLYIMFGLAWVVAGMCFGVWVGITGSTNYANSHAHANLLGFVTSVLFGLLHWAYPALGNSKLAVWQFGAYQFGAATLVIGKILVDGGQETPFLQVGAIVTIIATALMLYLFAASTNASRA